MPPSVNTGGGLARVFPFLRLLPAYKPAWLAADLFAGLTLWGMLVPEGLAYAEMAGAPVQVGLYTLLASLPLYFLFGRGRTFVCAATSSSSIMMAAAVAPLAGGDPARYATLLLLLVLLTGLIFLLAGLLRLGFISTFLSEPVMTGFVFGMAVYIAAGQLPTLTGLPKTTGDTLVQVLHLIEHLGRANIVTLALGVGALASLFLMERLAPRLPAGLLVLGLSIVAVHVFKLETGHGVALVGAFPSGLPHVAFPAIRLADAAALLPGAFGVALVAFSQALGTAGTFAAKHGEDVDADRELTAMGLANLGSFLLGGLVNGGSMSSTAVNDGAGAKTQASGLTAGVMVFATMMFLTPVFHDLPKTVLAAIVIHAVLRLMKFGEMRRFHRWRRSEFALAMIALLGVLCLNLFSGLLIAATASILRLVWQAAMLPVSVMGRLPYATDLYVNVEHNPRAEPVPGMIILRLDGPLFFANAPALRDTVRKQLLAVPAPKAVLIEFKGAPDLDITSVDMLLALCAETRKSGAQLYFADVSPGARKFFQRTGLDRVIGKDRMFPTVKQAVTAFVRETRTARR